MQGKKSGFTLLEVMVSVAILAIAMVSVLKLHSDSMSILINARDYTISSQLAQYKITEIENIGVENIRFHSGTFEEYPGFRWEVELDSTPVPGWIKVMVNVSRSEDQAGKGFTLTEYMPTGTPENISSMEGFAR